MTPVPSRSLPMFAKRTLLLVALLLLAGFVLGDPAAALQQGGGLGSQNLRAYRFVFIAYAIAWVLVFGWIVAVARRLSRLDARLRD